MEGIPLIAVYRDTECGETDLDRRPGLSAALASVDGLRATMVVAAKLDRFARDADLAGHLSYLAGKAGAALVAADGGHKDPLRRDVTRAIDSEELRRIRARTREALGAKRARGERVGEIPFGFRLRADGTHRMHRITAQERIRVCPSTCTGCLHLEPDPVESALVARAIDLHDQGLSVRAVTSRLAGEAYTGRTGKPLSSTQVHRIVQRENAPVTQPG